MENKVICGCFNIKQEDMETGISKGISSFDEFQQKTGIGTGCPPCLVKNKILFEEILVQLRITLLDKMLVL